MHWIHNHVYNQHGKIFTIMWGPPSIAAYVGLFHYNKWCVYGWLGGYIKVVRWGSKPTNTTRPGTHPTTMLVYATTGHMFGGKKWRMKFRLCFKANVTHSYPNPLPRKRRIHVVNWVINHPHVITIFMAGMLTICKWELVYGSQGFQHYRDDWKIWGAMEASWARRSRLSLPPSAKSQELKNSPAFHIRNDEYVNGLNWFRQEFVLSPIRVFRMSFVAVEPGV